MSMEYNCTLAIYRAANAANRLLTNELRGIGIPYMQAMILCELADRPAHTATHKDLIKCFQVRSSTMSAVVKRMMKSGLVRKTENSGDKRLNDVILTEKALVLVPQIRLCLRSAEAQLKRNLSGNELECFVKLAEKLKNCVTDELPKEVN